MEERPKKLESYLRRLFFLGPMVQVCLPVAEVLTVTTLGALAETQRLDGIDENDTVKRYMHL